MEQVLERNIFAVIIVALDFSIPAFILMLLHLIFNAFMHAAGIAILARHLQSQIPHDPSQVLALDDGLGFAITQIAIMGCNMLQMQYAGRL